MLQQTQVVTVIPYFDRWMKRFPNVISLASASEAEVLSLWQGLGYYSRARLLHKAACQFAEEGFPIRYTDWLKVPGVGEYTAAAISSIAFGEVRGVVDGNVKRVFARLTTSDLVGPALHNAAQAWVDVQIVAQRPGDWNQALMELGATICTPTNPRCVECPVSVQCSAFATERQPEFPRRVAKAAPTRMRESIVIRKHGDNIGFTRSHSRGWWRGLAMLPNSEPSAEAIDLGSIKYTVTTHRVEARIFLEPWDHQSPELEWHDPNSVESLAVPAPHRKALALLTKFGR